jgi:hypothetical protein
VTVNELKAALQAALDRGLPGSTTVVFGDHPDLDWAVVEVQGDPSDGTEDYDMWFTLGGSEPADARFTEGGMSPEWYLGRESVVEQVAKEGGYTNAWPSK